MKKFIYLLFCLLGGVSLLSCQSEDLDVEQSVMPDEINVPIEGTLLDGGEIQA